VAHASIHEEESVATKAGQSSSPAELCHELCVMTHGRLGWVLLLYTWSDYSQARVI